jgi:HrpA-like RNA helicase
MAIHRPVGGHAVELKGRHNETDVLDRLIEAVRAGESRVLVVRGEPGVGKTALLGPRGPSSGPTTATPAGWTRPRRITRRATTRFDRAHTRR